MDAVETFKRVHPTEFYSRFLQKGVRPDGRALTDTRKTTVSVASVSTAAGSSTVKVGHTTVVCGVVAELAAPLPSAPSSGFIVANVELGPTCSGEFRSGPPSGEAIQLSALLHDTFCDTAAPLVPSDALCIVPGELVWCLHVDCVCLDHDGNVADACVLAVAAALHSTKLPNVDTSSGKAVRTAGSTALACSGPTPISVSTVLMPTHALCIDPTRDEEAVADGLMRIIVATPTHPSEHSSPLSLIALDKTGARALSASQTRACLQCARVRAAEAVRLIHAALAAPTPAP